MALTQVTLTGTYTDGSGQPLYGTLVFTPSVTLTDITDSQVVQDAGVSVTLNSGGSFSVPLYSTDSTNLAPSGWAWNVEQNIAGLPPASWTFFLLFTNGATQDISSLTPVTEPVALSAYLPESGGTMSGPLVLNGSPALTIPAGAGSGKVLTSDPSGHASWSSAAGGTVTSVTAGDTSIVVGGTGSAPTLETGTLDVIATGHPPAAAWSNNSKKITSLADGSSAQDAAAFHQIPTSAGSIGGLTAANNLSDVANAATARTNLGLAGGATLPVSVTSPATGQELAYNGSAWQNVANTFSVKSFGAKGDGAAMHGAGACNMTSSSAVLTLPGLAAPSAPSPTNSGSGGTVAAGTYQVKITYTTAYGETLPSPAGSTTTSGSTSTITIPSPPSIDGANGWNAYVTQAGGSTYTLQQPGGGPAFIGTSYVLTAAPSSGGAAPPGANTSMPSLFASSDVGKNIVVAGAGSAGANLVTTISTFTSATQVSLAATASTTVTSAAFTYYTQIDTTAVQNAVTAALAAAGTSGGAVLKLPPGGYVISGVTFGSRLTVQGAGKDATFLIMDPAATTGSVVCRVGPPGTAVTNCTLRDLTIDGNKYMWDPAGSQKAYGYYLGSGVTNQVAQCQVIDVKIRNCLTYGLDIERAQYTSALRVDVHDCGFSTGSNHNADGITAIGDDITLTDCRAWNNAVQGIRCGQSAALWHRVQVIGCEAWGNASKGISLGSDTTAGDGLLNSAVIGGAYFSNGDAGIYLTSQAISCTVSGAASWNNTANGILLSGAVDCTITGCTVKDNATGGSSNPEIYLTNTSTNNTITGNTVTSVNATNAVKEQSSASDYNTVTANSLTSTGTLIVLAGTHSVSALNPGFDSPPVTTASLPLAISSGGTGTATGAPQNDVFAGPTSGTGAPSFRALVAADLPAGTTSAKGALQLDGTSGDIVASPGTAAAGATGKAADAAHVHPSPSIFAPGGLTGATAASRYAGATASGAPASGTFSTGDFVIDQTGNVWVCTSGGTPGTWQQVGGPISVQWVTSTGSYTWNKPAGAQTVDVILCGGGGGGASGAIETTGNAGGGGGGGGASVTIRSFVASDLPSSVTGSVGTGGTGGAAVSGTSASNGNNGASSGTSTTFGALCLAGGGNLAAAGSTSGGGGGSAGAAGTTSGGAGGAGGAAGAGAASVSTAAATGGGGGGGANTGTAFNGGTGALCAMGSSTNTGSAGVAGGASPGTGTQPSVKGTPSCGGGGGAGANGASPAAQNGANAFYGGGGGGGGGAFIASGTGTSGAGGNGGNGFALIISHFA